MTLLTICFNSLSWKDTINCQRCASVLCWTLLKQVLIFLSLPLSEMFYLEQTIHQIVCQFAVEMHQLQFSWPIPSVSVTCRYRFLLIPILFLRTDYDRIYKQKSMQISTKTFYIIK